MKGGLSALNVVLESATKAVMTEAPDMGGEGDDEEDTSDVDAPGYDGHGRLEVTDEVRTALITAVAGLFKSTTGEDLFEQHLAGVANDVIQLVKSMARDPSSMKQVIKRVARNPGLAARSAIATIKQAM